MQNTFQNMQKGDRIIMMDGLVGGTTTGTVQAVHHEEEMILYMDKNGNENFALFEEVIKTL